MLSLSRRALTRKYASSLFALEKVALFSSQTHQISAIQKTKAPLSKLNLSVFNASLLSKKMSTTSNAATSNNVISHLICYLFKVLNF